jgi:uracil-DNA glycosylase
MMLWKDFIQKQDMTEIENVLKKCQYYPPKEKIYYAFRMFPQDIRVVFIGQDPYHDEGQATGLAFSVPKNIKIPPSLINIFNNMVEYKHLEKMPSHGDLSILTHQGCFFINTALTVEAHKPNSHTKYWKPFFINLIKYLSSLHNMVFVLWGGKALEFKKYIDKKHKFVISSHPSPLGYKTKLGDYSSFYEQDHFKLINEKLKELNYKKIYWNMLI